MGLIRKSRSEKENQADLMSREGAILHLLLSCDDMKAVRECDGDWMAVRTQLGRLTVKWRTGKMLFFTAQCQVMQKTIDVHLDAAIRQCFTKSESNQTLSTESLVKFKNIAKEQIQQIAGVEQLPPRRIVACTYFNRSIDIRVDSLVTEIDTKFGAIMKQVGVEKGQLKKFTFEDIVVPNPGEPWKDPVDIPDTLLAGCAYARKILARNYDDMQSPNAEKVTKMVGRKALFLLVDDGTFHLEIGACMSVTKADAALLLQRCLDALAEAKMGTSPTQVLGKLQALKVGTLYKLSTDMAKNKLEIAMNILVSIVEKRAPCLKNRDTDQFKKQVLQAVGHFMTYPKSAKEKYTWGYSIGACLPVGSEDAGESQDEGPA